jgi:SAD/SRA domain-containing protein
MANRQDSSETPSQPKTTHAQRMAKWREMIDKDKQTTQRDTNEKNIVPNTPSAPKITTGTLQLTADKQIILNVPSRRGAKESTVPDKSTTAKENVGIGSSAPADRFERGNYNIQGRKRASISLDTAPQPGRVASAALFMTPEASSQAATGPTKKPKIGDASDEIRGVRLNSTQSPNRGSAHASKSATISKTSAFKPSSSNKGKGRAESSETLSLDSKSRSPTAGFSPPPSAGLALQGLTVQDNSFAPIERPTNFFIPEWYSRGRGDTRNVERATLNKLSDIVTKYKIIKTAKDDQSSRISDLLDLIQSVAFCKVTRGSIIENKLFDKRFGLPAIASDENIPWYLRSDARILFYQWEAEVFQFDPLGSLKHEFKTNGRITFKTDEAAVEYYQKRKAQEFGNNGLTNGQWFPRLHCALHFGAHGAPIKGISGKSGQGAYSIMVAMQYEGDKDEGDLLYYTGTEGGDEPSKDTMILISSCDSRDRLTRLRRPVRVIRSHKGYLNRKSSYCPQKGYRYDGLYEVQEYAMFDASKSHYLFTLRRCPGQDPIRYSGPEARPNLEELKWYEEDTHNRLADDD